VGRPALSMTLYQACVERFPSDNSWRSTYEAGAGLVKECWVHAPATERTKCNYARSGQGSSLERWFISRRVVGVKDEVEQPFQVPHIDR
jgi:hypothetical protein